MSITRTERASKGGLQPIGDNSTSSSPATPQPVASSRSSGGNGPTKPRSASGIDERLSRRTSGGGADNAQRSSTGGYTRRVVAAPATSSSSSLVRSLVTDVVASRRLGGNSDRYGPHDGVVGSSVDSLPRSTYSSSSNRPVSMSARSVAASSAASSASLSLASVAKAERILGRPLPTDEGGSHVILTKKDLLELNDPETLEFLREHSEAFSKYVGSGSVASTPNGVGEEGGRRRRGESSNNADDIAKHVDALCHEIETFMTAVDFEGNSYHIHLDEMGELHVPFGLGGSMAQDESEARRRDDIGMLDDLITDDDLAAFDAEFGLGGDNDDEAAGEGQHDEQMIDPFHHAGVSAEADVCSTVNMQSDDGTGEETSAEEKHSSGVVRRPLLEKLLDPGSRQRLQMIIKHHRGGSKPRYMATTEAQQRKESGSDVVPPSPPPPEKRASAFTVQHCGGGGASSAARSTASRRTTSSESPPVPKPQRATLSEREERRVQFILDNENWDGTVMGAAQSEAGSGGPLSYDEASASSYSAATGGYTMTSEMETKMKSIESRLKLLSDARHMQYPSLLAGPANALATPSTMSTAPPTSSPGPRSRGPSSKQRGTGENNINPTRVTSVPSTSETATAAVLVPSSAKAEQDARDALRRKQLGNTYLATVREDAKVRQQLSNLNDRLNVIHEAMDELVTPPFAFNATYEMNQPPESWAWPASAPPPSRAELDELLKEADLENKCFASLAAASARNEGDADVEEEHGASASDGANQTGNNNQSSAALKTTPFLQDLRSRFQHALSIAQELESHQYHRPAASEMPLELEPAAKGEDEIANGDEVIEENAEPTSGESRVED